jgi:voltage-gated potassium channel
MSPKAKFQILIYAVLGVVAFGTVGFKLIAGWPWFDCFYFTLITITTIGYSEHPGMTDGSRYFTVLLIVMGVSTIGYALSATARSVLEFGFWEARFGKRRVFKDIKKLKDHYIVCGAGRMGRRIIRELARRDVEFVVIESDEGRADRMLSQGYLVLMGDATNEEVLRSAGIERARALVCALASDPDNLYTTLTARDINKNLFIVARANDEEAINRLLKAGANKVVSPIVTGSNQMAQMLLKPAVADFIELATMTDQLELEIEQIEISSSSPVIGRALKDTTICSDLDVIIIAIKRPNGRMLFNPSAEAVFQAGDVLVAIGSHSNLEALERMVNPERPIGVGHKHQLLD